ncbi:BrnT family toxin [Asticcacaulis sp. EMRT-3]|uniref:BrnT family toxin n=1 Tax=Asticcacaulis sp. EMRT-3 TaxID=3040349 RepID=UPI0024AF061D|nr:BrnT family toxin [Asticcacaulis sp. EMRT-3]MDI7776252.1 BrnT family toxin [Asticcacaulis sp. EMRT-3]
MQVDAYQGFDWDDGNMEKCRKHGMSLAEIESLFTATPLVGPDWLHSDAEERFRAVGICTSGRYGFIVFTMRERDGLRLIRPISARYMHEKEIVNYERQRPRNA